VSRKPIIVVSRCLGFAVCRWNGVAIKSSLVNDLAKQVEFITVCPECEIGLGVPRQPIRLVQKESGLALVQPAAGADLTARMKTFSYNFISSLARVDGFLLKRKSPSCGIANIPIYSNLAADQPFAQGSGLFAQAVLEHFPDTPVEDETCLADHDCREKWLTDVVKMSKLVSLPSLFAVEIDNQE